MHNTASILMLNSQKIENKKAKQSHGFKIFTYIQGKKPHKTILQLGGYRIGGLKNRTEPIHVCMYKWRSSKWNSKEKNSSEVPFPPHVELDILDTEYCSRHSLAF